MGMYEKVMGRVVIKPEYSKLISQRVNFNKDWEVIPDDLWGKIDKQKWCESKRSHWYPIQHVEEDETLFTHEDVGYDEETRVLTFFTNVKNAWSRDDFVELILNNIVEKSYMVITQWEEYNKGLLLVIDAKGTFTQGYRVSDTMYRELLTDIMVNDNAIVDALKDAQDKLPKDVSMFATVAEMIPWIEKL